MKRRIVIDANILIATWTTDTVSIYLSGAH